jgi:hypothetical protein
MRPTWNYVVNPLALVLYWQNKGSWKAFVIQTIYYRYWLGTGTKMWRCILISIIVFRLLTDFVCLYTYEFWLMLTTQLRHIKYIYIVCGKCLANIISILIMINLTDFVCLYTYEFWLSLYKIIRSSVILLLPLYIF